MKQRGTIKLTPRNFKSISARPSANEKLFVNRDHRAKSAQEHEASPVAIILGAHKAAVELGDKEAPTEVLRVGLALLARWPYFLVGSTYGHPDFIHKPVQ